jgi:hypothetical protein
MRQQPAIRATVNIVVYGTLVAFDLLAIGFLLGRLTA